MIGVRPATQWILLAVSSTILAVMLEWARFPAALLLGPMLCGIALGVAGATVRVSPIAFNAAQAVIGCLVAHAITPAILVSIAARWPVMLGVVLTTVVASGLVGFLLVRFSALPGATAAWGSSPGAASAMVAMSEAFGADPRLVALMQYLRVVCVALTASVVSRLWLAPGGLGVAAAPIANEVGIFWGPPLQLLATLALAVAGSWLGIRLRIPAGAMLVPMIVGAILQSSGVLAITLPEIVLGFAYAAIGWYVGLRFNREVTRASLRALPQLLIGIFLLIGLCGFSAWGLVWLVGTDPLTAFLATSPGGLDAVAIIAVGSGADVSFVLALQTLRLFVVILTGPALARFISRYA